MRGDINPKQLAEFTNKERSRIDTIRPHIIVYDSATCRNILNELSLPMERLTMVRCKAAELKAMIVAPGGSVAGSNGRDFDKEQL